MSLDRVVEEIIQAAMARGEFDNLPGQGKPLNPEAYFALPEDERMAITIHPINAASHNILTNSNGTA